LTVAPPCRRITEALTKSAEQDDRAGHREGNADRGKEEAALRVWKTRWDADDAASGGEAERGPAGIL